MLRLVTRSLRPTAWPIQVTPRAYTSCKQTTKCPCPDPCANLAAVLRACNDLCLETRPIPEPKYDQALIKVGPVGLCDTDIHFYSQGKIGGFKLCKPMIVGHEAAGVVQRVGCAVKGLKCGDRVAIEPGVSCRLCRFCKEGRYNLCQDMAFCATPPIDGNMCRYHAHAADCCFKLPDNVTLEEGALIEPLSVGIHACRLAGVCPGCKVFIMGAGPIGLLTAAAARAHGAFKVGIADLNDSRLITAQKMCVDFTVKVCPGDDDNKFKDEVKCGFGGKFANVTIDCAGVEESIRRGLLVTRYGGKFVLVGVAVGCACVPVVPVHHEVDVIGCLRYRNCYGVAVSLVANKKIDPTPVVTHCFALEEVQKAFDTAVCKTGDPIKILVHANTF